MVKILKVIFILLGIACLVLLAVVFWQKRPAVRDSGKEAQKSVIVDKSKKANAFVWGISVSPYDFSTANSNDLKDWTVSKPLIDLAKELGVNTVRIGIPDWAFTRQDELIVPIVVYAKSLGLDVILGFDPPEGNPTKLAGQDCYQNGLKLGDEISKRFKGKVDYYQLSNEVSGTAMKPSWPGVSADSYDPVKYKQVLDWLKGASEGVHKNDPSAKRIVTGHWLGFGFFDKAIADGLQFEIIGWDWYSPNIDLTRVENDGKTYNLTQELRKFGKTLWITEADSPDGSKDGESKQAGYLQDFSSLIKSDKAYSGFFPLSLSSAYVATGQESIGLIQPIKDQNGKIVARKKESFYAYQNIISSYLK